MREHGRKIIEFELLMEIPVCGYTELKKVILERVSMSVATLKKL